MNDEDFVQHELTRRKFLGTGLAVGAGLAVRGIPKLSRADSNIVTVYSADGLHNGTPNWYATQFKAFTKQTVIEVQFVEAGSAVIVNRLLRERANPQADLLVTLPPF